MKLATLALIGALLLPSVALADHDTGASPNSGYNAQLPIMCGESQKMIETITGSGENQLGEQPAMFFDNKDEKVKGFIAIHPQTGEMSIVLTKSIEVPDGEGKTKKVLMSCLITNGLVVKIVPGALKTGPGPGAAPSKQSPTSSADLTLPKYNFDGRGI